MSFLKNCVAIVLTFIGFRKFLDRKYFDAIRYFEKALRYKPGNDTKITIFLHLGPCYVVVEEYDKAVDLMSSSYELISREFNEITDNRLNQAYMDYYRAYIYALNKTGNSSLAREIKEKWKL